MELLLDKALLLLSGIVLLVLDMAPATSVLLFLLTLIFLCLDDLIRKDGYITAFFFGAVVLSFIVPQAAFFLPCFLYSLFSRKKTALAFFCLLPVLLAGSEHMTYTLQLLLLLFLLFAAALSDLHRRHLALLKEFRMQRDTDKEEQLLLKKQTEALRKEQDSNLNLAMLQERTRIAREIHDNVGHLLSRSLLQLGALLTIHKEDESLLLLKESLDAAMNGIRNSVHDLRDQGIELKSSTRLLLSDCKGYHTDLTYEISSEPPISVTYCLLTITKEAISNTIKHSNADSISVKLQEFTSLYHLSIADNGTTAALPSQPAGMGLENMQARALALGGTIRFSVQDGFHIFVSIPKENEHESSDCRR